MRYPFLIIDHDDTSVASSAGIHYPAHIEVMKRLRPGRKPISLETWFLKNFHPGIMEYFTEELLFSEAEVSAEYEIWRSYTESRVPSFYPGFLDAIRTYQDAGGRVAVVSHSDPDIIKRDYSHSGFPADRHPEVIFGWHRDPTKRKPNPYPVHEILRRFGADKRQVLVLDDLKPGIEMAKAAGVDSAGAGWAHNVTEIERYMKATCVTYLKSVEEFARFIMA